MLQRNSITFVSALSFTLVMGASACGKKDDATAESTPIKAPPTGSVSVQFDERDTLELSLGQEVEVAVTLSPATSSLVRFALLGDYADAALSSPDDSGDPATATPDDQGHARIIMHAPTKSATFALRASVDGGGSTVRAIGASGEGFATVVVLPAYDGKRDSSQWTATAAAGQSCADHAELPVTDGPIAATSQGQDPLVLEGVPVGAKILVTLRSQHALSGCVDLAGLQVNEKRMLMVKAQNVPATLRDTPFDVQLSMTPDVATWPSIVTTWGARFRASFTGGAKTGGGVSAGTHGLLDTMALTFPVAMAESFQTARMSSGWDSHLATALGGAADPALALETWLAPALQKMTTDPRGVAALLAPGAAGTGTATMTPNLLLGIDAASGDTLVPAATTLTLDADDLLHAAGKLGFWPSRAVARTVSVAALSATGTATVPQAIGTAVSCSAIAGALGAEGTGLAGCDAKCLATACTQAISTMWERAGAADEQAQENGTLTFAASGALSVDGDARALGFVGTWVGSVSDSASTGTPMHADAKGTATGALQSSTSP